MKIDNKLYIRKIVFLSVIIIFLTGSLSVITFLVPNLFPDRIIYFLAPIFFISVFVYKQLRYIELDFSGEVLVFKSYHPLKSGRYPHEMNLVELPKQMITNIIINKGFYSKKIIIKVQSETDQKSREIKLNLSQMSVNSLSNIHNELKKCLNGR